MCDKCESLDGPERMKHIREEHPERFITDPPIKLVSDED